MILKANIKDAKVFSEIALQSKAIWGYSEELLKTWQNELTVTEGMLRDNYAFKFILEDDIVGFYILLPPKNKCIELDFLFIVPKGVGNGIGKKLLRHAIQISKEKGATKMKLYADPNAEGFYEKQGFLTIERKESTVTNRLQPVMIKVI